MKIHLLANDGSPLGVTTKTLMGNDPVQVGVGGSECGLLTMCEVWQKAGHEVVLFNDPREQNASPFEQRAIGSFDPNEHRDVLIVVRSPNLRIVGAKADLMVWWSHDQHTVGNFASFAPLVDKIVCISPYHQQYFAQKYNITNTISIDLPVRVWEYENQNVQKVKNRFIFTSVPARGLDVMLDIWPMVLRDVPDATLVITSDYRLWGMRLGGGNEKFIARAIHMSNIQFLSAVPRLRLVEEQLKAEVHLYPCIYDELFCIAAAESQVAGVYLVSSDFGALATTNMMTIHKGDPNTNKKAYSSSGVEFCHQQVHSLDDIQKKAKQRFHPDTILKEWDEKVFNG